jgi:hypothetical protein
VRSAVGCGFALACAACGFQSSVSPPIDAAIDAPPPVPPWWDDAYPHRRQLTVTTGAVHPDKGYVGYTVRLPSFNATNLTGLTERCDDLRVVAWDGTQWTELARHLVGCGTPTADLRFALPIELEDGVTYRNAYVYYGNPNAGPPAPADGTAVYLWWDPAAQDRSADYVHGRMDPWIITGFDDSLRWDSQGHYTYDTGDDRQSSYRRAVEERDVFIEVSLFHTGCYVHNMQTGVCARGVIASGSGETEEAEHYYCTSRGQNPECDDTDQAIYDGDIIESDNELIALNNPLDPPPIVPRQWRKQALGVFGINPTQLRFWDADEAWPGLATPPPGALVVMGNDETDHEDRGFAGIMTAQDKANLRDLVIRRYVEPEPKVVLEAEQTLRR